MLKNSLKTLQEKYDVETNETANSLAKFLKRRRNELNRTLENKFTIKVPANSQRITIAVPINGKQPVSIEYVQQGDAEYISNFEKSIVSVSGATPGENMMDYIVYSFIFLIPCGAMMTFNVTLE